MLDVGSQKKVFNANPEVVGPGWWHELHVLARFCDSKPASRHQFFIDFLSEGLTKYFPCLHCRAHAVEYIKSHPVPNKASLSPVCAKWVYDFHNTVNARLE